MKRNKREENKERSKEQILRSALELFSLKGYGSTTLDMIAERAGVSKGLPYLYFESKEAILYTILERHFEKKKEMEQAFKTDHQSAIEIIDDFIRVLKVPFIEGLESETCLEIRLFMSLMLQSETKTLIEPWVKKFQKDFIENHFLGIKDQFERFGIHEIDKEIDYLRVILFGYLFYKICLGNDFPEKELESRIREVFLYKLSTNNI